MALTDKLTAIGNAIRAKTGGTSPLTLTQMVDAIGSISGGGYVSPYYAEYDFTQGLNDLARKGVVATPYAAPASPYPYEIDSTGLAVKKNTMITDLHIPVSVGLTVEFDIATETKQSGTNHERLIMWAAPNTITPDSGVIRRSNNYWAIYTTSGGWTYASTSNTMSITGRTVKVVFRTSSFSGFIACDAYIDNVLVATNEKVNTAHTNLYLCSSAYGAVVTVSRVRAYQN